MKGDTRRGLEPDCHFAKSRGSSLRQNISPRSDAKIIFLSFPPQPSDPALSHSPSTHDMAKKRKATSRSAATEGDNTFEERGGRLGPITSYEDVAASEDEFHIQRDKLLLDEGPDVKRRRKWAEEGLLLPFRS